MKISFLNLLLVGYLFIGCILNIVAFFISSFYKRRLHQSSPQIGFVVAIFSSLICAFLILFQKYGGNSNGGNSNIAYGITGALSLIIFGITSSYSILSLYFVMRSVRK